MRGFAPSPVSDEDLGAILEVARQTGSAMNAQPWEFVVVRDPARIAALAATGPNLGWLAGAPLAIAVVMAGERRETEGFDEGRLVERIMVAANALGLGAGLGWFFGPDGRAAGRQLLGVPEPKQPRTVIAIGHVGGQAAAGHPAASPNGNPPATRKPLAELVHYDHFGRRGG